MSDIPLVTLLQSEATLLRPSMGWFTLLLLLLLLTVELTGVSTPLVGVAAQLEPTMCCVALADELLLVVLVALLLLLTVAEEPAEPCQFHRFLKCGRSEDCDVVVVIEEAVLLTGVVTEARAGPVDELTGGFVLEVFTLLFDIFSVEAAGGLEIGDASSIFSTLMFLTGDSARLELREDVSLLLFLVASSSLCSIFGVGGGLSSMIMFSIFTL